MSLFLSSFVVKVNGLDPYRIKEVGSVCLFKSKSS